MLEIQTEKDPRGGWYVLAWYDNQGQSADIDEKFSTYAEALAFLKGLELAEGLYRERSVI